MPGFLYRYPQFKKRMEQPILAGDDAARLRLARMVTPFLLRRKKADVLRELPEKIEQVRYVDLTPRQQKLYQAQEQQLRLSLQNEDDQTFQANRIQYLSALTRLRQLCCDPALFLEQYDGGSGKVEACLELLALQEKGADLLFSLVKSSPSWYHNQKWTNRIGGGNG